MAAPGADADWAEQAGNVSRLRGKAFEAICLSATSLSLISVLVLLLFVAMDAFDPLSADPGWHLVYFLTLVVPALTAAVYYYRLDEPAGEVAYATLGIPIVGVLVATGMLVLFIEVLAVAELFATAVATVAAVGAIIAHSRLRPKAAVERLGIIVLAPTVAIFGVPPAEVISAVNGASGMLGGPTILNTRIISLREVILSAPFLPVDWMSLVLTITVPVSAGFGLMLARRRESNTDGIRFVGLMLAGAVAGLIAGPAVGIGVEGWIVIFSFIVPPLGVYVEGVIRRKDGIPGLAFPLLLIGGVLLGAFLVRQVGFAPPDPWLNWDFLTNSHSRFDPRTAGIYPPLVGSVMMLFAIIILIFPVGVGAAIYLEEYAPDRGFAGKVVSLIEVNIGNLAGVPSVVYGLLGLALFIRFMNLPSGAVVVGALAVGLLILPIVIISAQEALRAVPDSHRQAAYGMGATRWQVIRDVVLPQAFPGILTGTILALGRAIGETAPLLMIGMPAIVRLAPDGFFSTTSAMPRQIFSWSTEIDPAFRHGVLAAGVVTLLAVLLIMNGTAIILRNKFQREAQS